MENSMQQDAMGEEEEDFFWVDAQSTVMLENTGLPVKFRLILGTDFWVA